MEPVEIVEAGLLLRSWCDDDAGSVYRACQDPLIQRWTQVPAPYLPEHAKIFVGRLSADALAADSAVHLGVFNRSTGALLGSCGIVSLDLPAATGEIGYWTAPWARGTGVASGACRALARWGLETLGLRRIGWRAAVGNHLSRLVAQRTGFRLDGVVRAGRRDRTGQWVDAWVGSLLPGDPLDPDLPEPDRSTATRRAAVFSQPQPELVATARGGPIGLRAPRRADLAAIASACEDAESVRWTTLPLCYRPADAEFFIGPYAQGRWSRGDGAVFAIVEPGDRYAGSIELRISPADPAVADVGYLVAPWARGRGYAPTALRALCEWGFDALGLARIEWEAHVGNEASRRVAEKAGFTIEGVARARSRQRGERRDAWVGALLAGDLDTKAGTRSADANRARTERVAANPTTRPFGRVAGNTKRETT